MSLSTFTVLHVVISLVGLASGAFVVPGSGSFTAPNQYTFSVNKGSGNNGSTYNLTIDAGAFSDNLGNTNASTLTVGLKPAGIAGQPINLGLFDPTGNHGVVTLTVLALSVALPVIVNVAVTVVLVAVIPLTVTPVPDTFTAVAPVRLVPVSVTGTAVPRAPEVGAINVSVGTATAAAWNSTAPASTALFDFLGRSKKSFGGAAV